MPTTLPLFLCLQHTLPPNLRSGVILFYIYIYFYFYFIVLLLCFFGARGKKITPDTFI